MFKEGKVILLVYPTWIALFNKFITQLVQKDFIGLGYIVLFSTFLVYLLNLFALRYVNTSVVSSFIYMQPIVAAIFSWFFYSLGTYSNVRPHFSWGMLGATLLIFVGVWLVSYKPIQRAP